MNVLPEKQSPSRDLRIFCYQCQQKLDVTKLEAFSKIACPTCETMLIVPKWFDAYMLEEECGVGGAATVYRALDLTLEREVALKIFSSNNDSEQFVKTFLHEGRVCASLNHPGIMPIYSCGQSEDKCFLVMQYIPGGNLEAQIEKKGKLKISRVLEWVLDIAIALEAALKAGVVHHDIKPANILLDLDDKVKISDFGLAYALHDAQSESLLPELSSFGSPDYVSPEKLLNGFEDNKGDIFSLGATFYELLTGKKPFPPIGKDEEILEVREKTPVIAPYKQRSDISRKLSKLVMQMMAEYPAQRPDYDEIISNLA
jgi:serine/threonine protein kinase